MEQKVQVPAIVLMIVGGLNALLQLSTLGLHVLSIGVGTLQQTADQSQLIANMLSGTIGLITALLGLIASGVILYGAWQMYRFERYGMALTAAILTCIPCFTCCCVGVPVGVWALVVLSDASVKESFLS